ncbi:MAG: N-formylglutamate amidohydrolase [Sandaracinaceae bacterium]
MSGASIDEAYDRVRRDPDARVFVSCEHASQRSPDGFAWPEQDAWLLGTHWAFDLGAAELADELGQALSASVLRSRFSRLWIDPNRPEDSSTLFRDVAEGRPVHVNTALLDDAERARRIERLLRPYHAAFDAEVAASRAELLFSVHTFTPEYEGQKRALEVGVLFTDDAALAAKVADALSDRFSVALNEPYSGHDGLMYAVDRHAKRYGRRALEIEVRQDLAIDPAARREVIERLVRVIG